MVIQYLKQIRKVKKLDEWVPQELTANQKIVILKFNLLVLLSFPGGSDGKESACNAGGMQSINPWVRKIPGGGISNPPQYSCLEKPMDRGAWWATVHGVAKSQTD